MEMTCMTPPNTAGVTCADPSVGTSYGYTYNANGLRMSQTSPGGTTEQFTWNTHSSIPQLLMDGSNAYIYGPQGTALGTAPVEQISLSAPNSQSSVTYLVSDPEGARLTFNSSGTITAGATYSAYGNVIAGGLSNVTPFGYAGGYTDPTGLIYLVNRYYDPSTGQFLSVDPLVGITDQPYQYVGGDPVNLTDPLGLWWCMPQGASGPCPTGYTPGPPYNMNSPQPPESLISPVACGKYQLWTAMGSLEYFAANGNSIGGESESQGGYGPFITNSPTTTQEWQQYLSHLFPSSGTKRSHSGNGYGPIVVDLLSCVAGAESNLSDGGKQLMALGTVLAASQIVPGADLIVDASTAIATAGNALLGCASGVLNEPAG